MRPCSEAGIRLSAFPAGPARSSAQFMAEVVERHVVTAGNGRPTTANRAQFGGSRRYLGNPTREVRAERFPQQFRAGAVLRPSDAFELDEHGRWK